MIYREQFLEFISDRKKDKISDKEHSKIETIFQSKYTLSSNKYSAGTTSPVKGFVGKYIHKYDDDWWCIKQGLKILSGSGIDSDIKQKQVEALPLGESMKPETHQSLADV